MHADIREVAERRRELVRPRRVSSAEPLPRVESIFDCTLGWTSPRGHDPRALRARDRAAERAVADVGDEVVEWAAASSSARLRARARAASRVRGCGRDRVTHVTRIRARVSRSARDIWASVRAMYLEDAWPSAHRTTQRRASVLEIIGAWLHVWVPPRDVDVPPVPWRKLAHRLRRRRAGRSGIALAIMIPRIDDTRSRRAAQNARVKRKRRRQQPGAHHRAPAAARHGEATYCSRPPARRPPSARPRRSCSHSVRGRHQRRREGPRRQGRDVARSGPRRPASTAAGTPTPARSASSTASWSRARSRRARPTPRARSATRSAPSWTTTTFTYALCKIEQIPGEKLVPDPSKVVQLPAACQVPIAAIRHSHAILRGYG